MGINKQLDRLMRVLISSRNKRIALDHARDRLDVARADYAWHIANVGRLEADLECQRGFAGGLWLDLMNSMSHRRFLKLITSLGDD